MTNVRRRQPGPPPAAGLLALVGLSAFGLARGRPDVWWPALLFLSAWVGDATLVAFGGEVHGRYGARLVWVAPLAAGALALRAAAAATDDVREAASGVEGVGRRRRPGRGRAASSG